MNALGVKDQVTIFVKREGSEITEKYDKDDQCMNIAIASFEILSGHSQGSNYYCENKPRIVLHLRDFSGTVKYVTEDGTEVSCEEDKEVDVVACATESVLRVLHKNHCVGKETVSFQSRRGDYVTQDVKVSGISTIVLNQNSEFPLFGNFKKGIISKTYAYLSEKKLCLFLNEISQETLDKIDSVLFNLFPRKSD